MSIVFAIGFTLVFLFSSYMRSFRYKAGDDAPLQMKLAEAKRGFGFYRLSAIATGIVTLLFIYGYLSGKGSADDMIVLETWIFACCAGVAISIIFAVSFNNKCQEYIMRIEEERKASHRADKIDK